MSGIKSVSTVCLSLDQQSDQVCTNSLLTFKWCAYGVWQLTWSLALAVAFSMHALPFHSPCSNTISKSAGVGKIVSVTAVSFSRYVYKVLYAYETIWLVWCEVDCSTHRHLLNTCSHLSWRQSECMQGHKFSCKHTHNMLGLSNCSSWSGSPQNIRQHPCIVLNYIY